jgi:hypothetical protein
VPGTGNDDGGGGGGDPGGDPGGDAGGGGGGTDGDDEGEGDGGGGAATGGDTGGGGGGGAGEPASGGCPGTEGPSLIRRRPDHNGTLPCLRRGSSSRLVANIRSPATSFWRVSAGSITSSM